MPAPTTTESMTAVACCAAFYEQDWVQAVLGDSFHPGGTDLTARLVRGLHLPPNARVLDVACGIGTQAIGLARRGFAVTASDVSAGAVRRARA